MILRIHQPAKWATELAALDTVAMRVPDDALARAILNAAGAAATTANPASDEQYLAANCVLAPADLLVQHGPTRYDANRHRGYLRLACDCYASVVSAEPWRNFGPMNARP